MSLAFTFLGTGCPVATPLRRGPAHLIASGETRILVDCGSGVAQQLVAAGCPGARVDALIVTHLHSDHLVDFVQLVVSSWHQGRARPWQVFAPLPALRNLRAQWDAFAEERAQRIAHERRPSADGLRIEWHVLEDGALPAADGLRVSAFAVDHAPVVPAYGLTFEAGSSRIVFSGDTQPCAALEEAARDADLFVCEVYVDREMQPSVGVRSAETVAAVRGYHCTPAQVARIAHEAGAKALALTHLVPPAADRVADRKSVV